jgi:aspartyl-tRNA(Asn)/glutamyl-tRNA(Gln) amidotransferase subunit A
MMGKTNTHEWAFGTTGDVSYFGPPRNPWDSERVTGGSSGGSAAAVASGMVYMATGTDTGGSVRIPAALCGVVGYKPTFGLASLNGVIPLSFTLDHPGAITRSVMDAAIAMDAMAGKDFAQQLINAGDLKGVRLGVPENHFFDKTDYKVEAAFNESVKKLEALGAIIMRINIPYVDDVVNISTAIMFSEAAWYHKSRIAEHPEAFQPAVLDRLTNGMNLNVTEYIQALYDRNRLISLWEETMASFDAVITPTVPTAAFKINSTAVTLRGREEAAQAICHHHTRLANVLGAPALSVPCGMADGLPVGLQIIGMNGCDKRVLEIGYAYEKQYPFNLMRY